VKDFIRQKEDVGPLMQAVQHMAGVDTTQVLERQLQLRQRPENQDLPVAPAQLMNAF
jgi:MerR family transcriptional regulator, heat shock protein HspR